MLNPIASFCVYFAEMVIAYIFFSGIFEHRISAKKCVLSGIALFSVCSVLNLLSRNNVIINGFSTFFMTLLFFSYLLSLYFPSRRFLYRYTCSRKYRTGDIYCCFQFLYHRNYLS